MARRGVLESDANDLFRKHDIGCPSVVSITKKTDLLDLVETGSWIKTEPLVVKPNVLVGRRGKMGLVGVNLNWQEAQEFIKQKLLGQEVTVGKVTGVIERVLVEKYIPHSPDEEFMVSIKSVREGAELSQSAKAGMEVDANWEKYVKTMLVPIDEKPDQEVLLRLIKEAGFADSLRSAICDFSLKVFDCYDKENAALVQINPFTLDETGAIIALDAKIELDESAKFLHDNWQFEFPPKFGQKAYPEEEIIREINEKSGASLTLKILNEWGEIALITVGGGGSMVVMDWLCALGYGPKLINYTEYSGNPPADQVFALADQIISVMIRHPAPPGEKKYLFILGGIANFTNVKNTFAGIIQALRKHQEKLREHRVILVVRRGGPEYQAGLEAMRKVGEEIGLETHIFDPYQFSLVEPIKMVLSGGDKK